MCAVLHLFFLGRYSGPTIHFVDEHYDTGRILAQRVVPVLANDTADELAARVLQKVFEFFISHFATSALVYIPILCDESELFQSLSPV